jgi:hypothetical protein
MSSGTRPEENLALKSEISRDINGKITIAKIADSQMCFITGLLMINLAM